MDYIPAVCTDDGDGGLSPEDQAFLDDWAHSDVLRHDNRLKIRANAIALKTAVAARGTDVRSTASAAGLSKPHISPQARITCWLGGSLISVRRGVTTSSSGGGTRGIVKGFSDEARSRMMRKMATVDRHVIPIFVTLTYPDQFPKEAATWSRHMDRFAKRLARRGWGAVWRKEFKPRKTGENKGEWAPHFHLLVWGCTYAELFLFAKKAWYQIVKSPDERHKRVGVRVEMLRSPRGVRGYVSKYIGKDGEDDLSEEFPNGVGRCWGILNEEAIPWAEAVTLDLSSAEAVKLIRLMRRYMRVPMRKPGGPLIRLKPERGKKNVPTVRLMCDEPEYWFDNLEQLV